MANNLFLKLVLIGIGGVCSATCLASNPSYYDAHAKGWHWYEEPPVLKKEKKETAKDPIQEMNAVKHTIERSLDQAILHPSEENIQHYIVLQNELSQRSSYFAGIWQKVLLEHPELNYSLIHPTNSLGTAIDNDLKHEKEDKAIHEFSKQTGLFFFYRSTCPYCQRFAPIVREFAEHYGMTVIPITLDGISLPEFPHSKQDHGQAARFHVTVEPSLFAVNPYTHKAYPVSYGLQSEEALRERILDIATGFVGGN